jgi:hypothetical protein
MLTAPAGLSDLVFIQSLFDAQQQGSLLNQIAIDNMSLITIGIVMGLIIIVIVILMSMVGGLHVFD